MNAIDTARAAFEQTTVRSFSIMRRSTERNAKGQYIDPTIADHWETFQEGWECGALAAVTILHGGDREQVAKILKQLQLVIREDSQERA